MYCFLFVCLFVLLLLLLLLLLLFYKSHALISWILQYNIYMDIHLHRLKALSISRELIFVFSLFVSCLLVCILQVKTHLASGNFIAARKASAKAKGMNIAALLVGVCMIIISLVYLFVMQS